MGRNPKSRGWDALVERVMGASGAWILPTLRESREQFAELQRTRAGERGDTAVLYQQKTHWAILDRFGQIAVHLKGHGVILTELVARLEALESAAEKAVPGMNYRGVWKDGGYAPGDVVTFGGSMFHCNKATKDKPGEGSTSWTLCVKRGRDGRDATEARR